MNTMLSMIKNYMVVLYIHINNMINVKSVLKMIIMNIIIVINVINKMKTMINYYILELMRIIKNN